MRAVTPLSAKAPAAVCYPRSPGSVGTIRLAPVTRHHQQEADATLGSLLCLRRLKLWPQSHSRDLSPGMLGVSCHTCLIWEQQRHKPVWYQ